MTDEDLKIITGTDVALYIIFNRYAAIFFCVMSIFNAAIFIPIYVSGYPDDHKNIEDKDGKLSIVSLLTVLNITGNLKKISASYALMTIFYTGLSFTFMFFYWKKSLDWRYRKHSHKSKFEDHDIALHSVIVYNLPFEVPVAKMTLRLRNVFEKIFPESKVVNTKVISKLDDLYSMAVKLRKYRKLYRYYKHMNKDKPIEERKLLKKRTGWCKKVDIHDAEDYYKNHIISKSREIRIEKDKKMKYNGGFGFVTFISNLQVKKCMYRSEFKRLLMETLTPEERLETLALQWKIKQAPS